MAKVTSKLQVTLPKRLAERYGIRPGDDIEWVPAGDTIRVAPVRGRRMIGLDRETRLRLFDAATERQRARQSRRPGSRRVLERGWRREDLYERGRPR